MIDQAYLLLFIISFGLNLLLATVILIMRSNRGSNISFDEAFSILNNIIDTQRNRFNLGLQVLAKKYAVLNNSGQLSPPSNNIAKYSMEKKDLKTNITKKIVRSISKNTMKKILEYYNESGLVTYIVHELDRDDVGDES